MSNRFGQGIFLAIILFSFIVLTLALAQEASTGEKLCVPSLTQLKWPTNFPRWLGCALVAHESLAGGLIGAAGALFAAWLAWHAVMRQISSDAEQAYQAMRTELEPVVDMVNLYWRVVDASLRNEGWRDNGRALLRAMHTRPSDLQRQISRDLADRLDPNRRRQYLKLMRSLTWLSDVMDRQDNKEPLWFEDVRTMLSHFSVSLREFDRVSARKFRRRTKGRTDPRSIATQLESLVAEFEREGKI